MTIGAAELYRLKSDARRGLLENDLILERFFRRYGDDLSQEDGAILARLLALSDNDLMDLLIARADRIESLGGLCDTPEFGRVIQRLRERP